jgi:hypothetical protein
MNVRMIADRPVVNRPIELGTSQPQMANRSSAPATTGTQLVPPAERIQRPIVERKIADDQPVAPQPKPIGMLHQRMVVQTPIAEDAPASPPAKVNAKLTSLRSSQ